MTIPMSNILREIFKLSKCFIFFPLDFFLDFFLVYRLGLLGMGVHGSCNMFKVCKYLFRLRFGIFHIQMQ